MGNMLFNMLQNSINPQLNEMLKAFAQFKQGLNPNIAQQKVMQLLTNGQMSQEQFEQLKQQAKELSQFFK